MDRNYSGAKRVFVVDVEGAGPSPMSGVMTEFGIVDVESRQWFHGVLWDAEPHPDNPAKPVPSKENTGYSIGYSQFDLQNGAYRSTKTPKEVFLAAEKWVKTLADGRSPVLASDNNGYDGMWMTCGFDEHGIASPFGFTSRRIGDYAAGLGGDFMMSSKWKSLRDVPHTHRSHEDAQGNAGALRALWAMQDELKAQDPDRLDRVRELMAILRKR